MVIGRLEMRAKFGSVEIPSEFLSFTVLITIAVLAWLGHPTPEHRPTLPLSIEQKAPLEPEHPSTLVLPAPPPSIPDKQLSEHIPMASEPALQKLMQPSKDVVSSNSTIKVLRPVPEPPSPTKIKRDILQPTFDQKTPQVGVSSNSVVSIQTDPMIKSPARPVQNWASKPLGKRVADSATRLSLRPLRPPPATSSPKAIQAATRPITRLQSKTKRTGRALLRQLEHGQGPGIEIFWPETPQLRQRLHSLLTKCHGMRSVLMSEDGRLFNTNGRPGAHSQVDMDQTSGFVRQVSGKMTAAERAVIARIRAYHGDQLSGVVVRLFPRSVDAGLLRDLHAFGSFDYDHDRSITAAYTINAGHVRIVDVRIDGKRLSGGFELERIGRVCR